MANVQDLFGYRNISAAIEAIKTGIPDRLPPVFNTLTEQVIGNETTYHQFYGERRIVQRTEYGAPPKNYAQQPIGQKPIRLLNFNGFFLVEQELLLRLREPNSLMAQDRARDFIARKAAEFKQRFDNNRIAHQIMMLSKGKLWYDANGNLLPTSSGATLTVDFGIPANNQGQLNGIIDASWATTSTNIFQHIENLKKRAVQTTGRPIKHVFYGANVPGYIYKNDSFKYYFQFNPLYYQQFSRDAGAIPDGFMDLIWHPMRDAFWVDEAGSTQQLWDADAVVITPEIDRDVYTLYEGSIVIPTDDGVERGIDNILAKSELAYGIHGYSIFKRDPVGVKCIMGDNFLPTWKNPDDLYIADVTP